MKNKPVIKPYKLNKLQSRLKGYNRHFMGRFLLLQLIQAKASNIAMSTLFPALHLRQHLRSPRHRRASAVMSRVSRVRRQLQLKTANLPLLIYRRAPNFSAARPGRPAIRQTPGDGNTHRIEHIMKSVIPPNKTVMILLIAATVPM